MQSHGFFNLYLERIPKTVANAMTFTRIMGLRYLWVDRYCIAQDDQDEKHDQLRNMDLIYDRAHFVVIAAEGDGKDGLHLETSAVDDYRDHSPYLSADLGIVFESPTANTRWASRGWYVLRGYDTYYKFQMNIGIIFSYIGRSRSSCLPVNLLSSVEA
jgi:hypothetical protein